MVFYRKRPYAKKTGYKKRSYPKKKSGLSGKKTFEKRVKTVISRMAENKVQNFRTTLNILPYENGSWANTITPITPDTLYLNVVQGTGQGNRIGNSIRVKSLKMKGILRCMPYDATTNVDPTPMYVKMFFLTRKDTPTTVFPAITDLLQFGNASEGPGTSGSLVNLTRPVNTDDWTVHTTRTFKLGYANYAGTSADINAQTNANNDFKLNHFINIDFTKYCTKNIKFDDNTSNPSSRNIVMYPVVYTANSAAFTAGTVCIPAVLEYNLDIVYEDM